MVKSNYFIKAKTFMIGLFGQKAKKDNEGYFTLRYHKDFVIFNEPLLTANYSMNRLTIKGKKL